MTRKQFLRSALGVTAATLGLTVLTACSAERAPAPDAMGGGGGGGGNGNSGGSDGSAGSGSGSGTNTPRCIQDGTTTTIGDNHGHIMVVTADDVAAAVAKTYHIQGTSDHDHTVNLSPSDYGALQQDRAVMTTSSFDDGHDHSILVACA